MAKKDSLRTRIVGLRLTPDEYTQIKAQAKKSNSKRVSEYLRRMVFGKPVNLFYRNQSLDDFMGEMILLRQELNAIGNNFNQVVHKLHMVDNRQELEAWLNRWNAEQLGFNNQVAAIKNKINLIADKWLQ